MKKQNECKEARKESGRCFSQAIATSAGKFATLFCFSQLFEMLHENSTESGFILIYQLVFVNQFEYR